MARYTLYVRILTQTLSRLCLQLDRGAVREQRYTNTCAFGSSVLPCTFGRVQVMFKKLCKYSPYRWNKVLAHHQFSGSVTIRTTLLPLDAGISPQRGSGIQAYPKSQACRRPSSIAMQYIYLTTQIKPYF